MPLILAVFLLLLPPPFYLEERNIGMQCWYLEVLNPQHYDFMLEWLVYVVFESTAAVLVCWTKVIQSGIILSALSSSHAPAQTASEQINPRVQSPLTGPEITITAPATGHV